MPIADCTLLALQSPEFAASLLKPALVEVSKQSPSTEERRKCNKTDKILGMDINLLYNAIIQTLNESGHKDVVLELEKSSAAASTGSEALMASGFYLANLKTNNREVYFEIQEYIKEYLKYCEKNGLHIRYQR